MSDNPTFLVQSLLPPSSLSVAAEPLQAEPVSFFQVQVRQLFVRFQTNYGYLWSSQFQSDEIADAALAEWGSALAEFSPERIRKVAEYCFQTKGMPPTLPEFLRLCRPQMRECGLPDFEAAYHEACGKAHEPNSPSVVWSHPAVYWAGKAVGWRDLHHGFTGVRCRFDKAYQQFCKRVMAGEQLSFPTVSANALEHKGGVKTRTEQEKKTAQQWLSKIKQGLGSHGHV